HRLDSVDTGRSRGGAAGLRPFPALLSKRSVVQGRRHWSPSPLGSAASGAGDDLAEWGEVDVEVLWWDPLLCPGAASVGVAAEGFEVVVEPAELGEVFKFGDLGSAEAVAVVPFKAPAHVAPRNDARLVADVEGAA